MTGPIHIGEDSLSLSPYERTIICRGKRICCREQVRRFNSRRKWIKGRPAFLLGHVRQSK